MSGETIERAGDECKTRDQSESDNLKPMIRSKSILVTGAILAATAHIASAATFLVYKLNLDTDQFSVFVNPAVGVVEPTPTLTWTSTADLGSIGINSDPGVLFDEFRLGTTFADVTPVPEPGSIALLVCGLGAIAIGRRRAGL